MGLLDVCIANYSRGSQLQEHQVAQCSKLPWSGLRLVMGKFEFRTSLDEFGGSSLYSFVFEFTLIHKNEFC